MTFKGIWEILDVPFTSFIKNKLFSTTIGSISYLVTPETPSSYTHILMAQNGKPKERKKRENKSNTDLFPRSRWYFLTLS